MLNKRTLLLQAKHGDLRDLETIQREIQGVWESDECDHSDLIFCPDFEAPDTGDFSGFLWIDLLASREL